MSMETTDPLAPEEPRIAPAAPEKPAETVETQMQFLRLSILLLAAGFLVSTICFFLFLYKQNNLLIAQIDNQTRLLNQNEPLYESNQQKVELLKQDLFTYARSHNDIVPILLKYNLAKVQTPQTLLLPSTPAR